MLTKAANVCRFIGGAVLLAYTMLFGFALLIFWAATGQLEDQAAHRG